MKIFDNNQKQVDEIHEKVTRLDQKLEKIEKAVNERPSDIEKEVKQASKKATEYRNRILEKKEEVDKLVLEISTTKKSIDEKLDDISSKHQTAISETKELISTGDKLSNLLNTSSEFLENHPSIDKEIEEFESLHLKVNEISSKIQTTHKGIISRKSDIDELHREIIGYEEKGEEGEIVEFEGLKSKLEKTYDNLTKSTKKLEDEIQELSSKSENQYIEFIEKNQEDLKCIKDKFNVEYEKINTQIESLLPSALTAGLSSAFIKKKNEEEALYKEYKLNFKTGIRNLTLSALLPIGINVFLLLSGSTLIDTIEIAPKIMMAFLPLYIPLIWVTISENKKVNLSKRLIEEYSHKQVLSMTIEGLSRQIENIENSDTSEELRIRLLTNFLKVADENPGKLISNYQESDNPLLNLLDRKKSNEVKSIAATIKTKAHELIKDENKNMPQQSISENSEST